MSELLPALKSRKHWIEVSDRSISKRLVAAGLSGQLFGRTRRAPGRIAAEFVAFEFMDEGARVSASTIVQRWKQRSLYLPHN